MGKKFKVYSIEFFKFWSEKAVRSTRLCSKMCPFAIEERDDRYVIRKYAKIFGFWVDFRS